MLPVGVAVTVVMREQVIRIIVISDQAVCFFGRKGKGTANDYRHQIWAIQLGSKTQKIAPDIALHGQRQVRRLVLSISLIY